MKKFKNIIIPGLLLVVLLFSCDIVTPPYNENPEGPPVDTNTYVRNILLEEYTGARCGNCPRAAAVAQSLHEFYGDRVVLMTVHAGPYAALKGPYQYDFTTPEGDDFDSFFGNSKAGNPNGMISRHGYPNGHILQEGAWEGAIQKLLAVKPRLNIELAASVDTTLNEISIDYKIKYLMDGSNDDYLCLFVLEDSIIAYQTDYSKNPSDVPDYVHKHILRGSITGAWGEQLNINGISKDDIYEKNIKYSIPADKDWKPKNLTIVAFVYDNSHSYEIYQVTSKKVVLK